MKAARQSPRKRTTWTDEDYQTAFDIARLIIEEGKSQEEIAEARGKSRSAVQRLWTLAKEEKLLVQGVVPRLRGDALDELRQRLIQKLELRDARLVVGRQETLDATLPANTREAIFHSAARAAAHYLDEFLFLRERTVLCLAWGRVVHAVLQFLHPQGPRPGLTVVPLLGVLSAQPDWFEANALVQVAAAAYQTERYYCLPIPAIVRDAQQKQIAMELPLVRSALAQIRKATLVVTSVAPPDTRQSTLVKRGLLEPTEIEGAIQRGAIGEICAWWFDACGEPVPDDRIQPIGLGLDGLQDVIRRGGTVMAVVAADHSRIPPLRAAIRGRLVNVVVTDHVTAEALLRQAG